MSIEQQLLQHLKAGKSITPLEALDKWRCLRLGARVCNLRQAGYRIRTELIARNGKRFARYSMSDHAALRG